MSQYVVLYMRSGKNTRTLHFDMLFRRLLQPTILCAAQNTSHRLNRQEATTDDSSLAALQITYFFFLLQISCDKMMYSKGGQMSRCNFMTKWYVLCRAFCMQQFLLCNGSCSRLGLRAKSKKK